MKSKEILHHHKVKDDKDRILNKYSDKPFYDRNLSYKKAALGISYVLSILSLITASSFLYFSLLDVIGSYQTILVTAIAVVVVEFVKRKSTSRYLKDHYAKDFNLFALVISIITIAASILGSYFGTEKGVIYYTPDYVDIALNENEEATGLKKEIESTTNQIEAARNDKNDKGETYYLAKQTIKDLTSILASKTKRLDDIRLKISNSNDVGLKTHGIETNNNAKISSSVVAVFEIGFLICIIFLEYFDHRTYIELSYTPQEKTQDKTQDKTKGKSTKKSNPSAANSNSDTSSTAEIEGGKKV